MLIIRFSAHFMIAHREYIESKLLLMLKIVSS